MKVKYIILFYFLLLFSACGIRKAATAVTADILTRGMVEVETESDLFFAKESSLPLLKVLEVLHQGDPKNKKFLSLLAKAYGNYAFGFAELEWMKCQGMENSPNPPFSRPERSRGIKGGKGGLCSEWQSRSKRFYAKGRDYGISSLSRGKQSLADMPLPTYEKYLKKFKKKDVETLFWTAFDWGSFINMSRDDIAVVADLPRVEAMVDRVIELEPAFQCGIAHAFKGVFIAGNPLRSGSNPEASKPYFEKAISYCDGNFLMTKVMYAEWYAKLSGNKKLFGDILNEVILADASALPSQRLANELALARAKVLLK